MTIRQHDSPEQDAHEPAAPTKPLISEHDPEHGQEAGVAGAVCGSKAARTCAMSR
jgi:hypothetical protein